MKTTGIFWLSLVFAGAAFADTTQYYAGTARVLDLKTGAQHNEQVWVKRILAPEKSLLTEIACVKRPKQAATLSPVYLKIEGNRVAAISETPQFNGALSGTGEVQGEAWAWPYLKFSMVWKYPGNHQARIEDGNFLVGDLAIARKQIFYDDEPVQLWDIEMKAVTSQAFAQAVDDVHCPSF